MNNEGLTLRDQSRPSNLMQNLHFQHRRMHTKIEVLFSKRPERLATENLLKLRSALCPVSLVPRGMGKGDVYLGTSAPTVV